MKKPINYLKKMKIWAITAFILTLFLAGYLFYHSALDSNKSYQYSNALKQAVQTVFKVEDTVVPPQSLFFDSNNENEEYHYTNEKIKLRLLSTPQYADKEVTCEFSVDGCVQEGNYFRYTGADTKTIKVIARSVHNPEVKAEGEFILRGISPIDECVQEVKTIFVGDNNKAYAPDKLKVGMKYTMSTSLIIKDGYLEQYGLTENEILAEMLPCRFRYDGEDRSDLYQYDSWTRGIAFYDECAGNLSLDFLKGRDLYFDDIEGHEPINQVIPVVVTKDPAYRYIPTAPLKPNVGTYDAEKDEYVVTVPVEKREISIYGTGEGVPSLSMCRLEFRDEESAKMVKATQRWILQRKVNFGTCYLDMVSIFDENIRTKIRVEFQGNVPTKLTAYGKRVLVPATSDRYTYEFDAELYDQDKVEWKVIEGGDKVELDGSTLTAKWFGKAVLRAQSVYYPELYQDITIEIKMYDSLYTFVRKILGHFLLFAAFGASCFTTYFFFAKKKKRSFLWASFNAFTLAALTELVQYYTPGRSGLVTDVFINFFGSLTGIGLIFAFGLLYAIVTRKKNPEKYALLKGELSKISFREAFRQTKIEENETSDEDERYALLKEELSKISLESVLKNEKNVEGESPLENNRGDEK